MKKLVLVVAVLVLVAVASTPIIALANSSGPMGPAPNSGDGVSDGSGFDGPNGANGEIGSDSGPMGPAPNAGDGVSDGSGFDGPNGPNR